MHASAAVNGLGVNGEIGPELWRHALSDWLAATSVKHYAYSCNKNGEYAPGHDISCDTDHAAPAATSDTQSPNPVLFGSCPHRNNGDWSELFSRRMNYWQHSHAYKWRMNLLEVSPVSDRGILYICGLIFTIRRLWNVCNFQINVKKTFPHRYFLGL